MPLSHCKNGENVTLKEIHWGDKLKMKLVDMGLTPGVKFSVVNNMSGNCMVIDVRGTRLALGKGLVNQIMVERS